MNIVERIVAVYAPHLCLGCGVEGSIACNSCLNAMAIPSPCCYRCRSPAVLGRTCSECRRHSQLVSINAASVYQAVAKDLVWSLKFGRVQAAANAMAGLMAARYGNFLGSDVVVAPVPTANRRVRSRGYDQAVMIARALAHRSGCRYASLLVRHGSQEQKHADRLQRHSQLQGAFSLRRGADVAGKRVILIDDVLTTGATLEEAAAVLKASGARVVGGLVFVRA